jgi:hypothetical protein
MKEEGAVLGLPMYILITVVVAAVALVAIMGFMVKPAPQIGGWKISPDVIHAQGASGSEATWSGTVSVYVYDQNGHPLQGVKVILDGCNATAAGSTNDKGVVSLRITATLPANVNADEIQVTLRYHGPAGEDVKQDSIVVVRGK